MEELMLHGKPELEHQLHWNNSCDIPFSKVSTHMSRYGEYGIGLDKEAVLKNYGIQPIH